MQILRARPEDATALTEIAFAAKRHWGYPDKWIESWRGALTILPDFIADNETYAAVVDGHLVGFYALGRKNGTLDLLHLWVVPERMGRGIGRALFLHCLEQARTSGCSELEIESDPNAEGFYKRMGAQRIGVRTKRMDNEIRELPFLIFRLPQNNARIRR